MSFSTDVLEVSTSDGHNFVLLKSFSYTTNGGETIVVPSGATSNGASTPPELWPLIPPFGKYWMATYLHDYLYRYTQRSKNECDDIFKEAMRSLGVSDLEVIAIYDGVNLFGQAAFDSDRNK